MMKNEKEIIFKELNYNDKINFLWELACTGETENLKNLFDEYDSMLNVRYELFGKSHSLIMGAYRNRCLDTVEMLITEGGTIEPNEIEEIISYINIQRLRIMENLIFELIPAESERNIQKINELTKKLTTYSQLITEN